MSHHRYRTHPTVRKLDKKVRNIENNLIELKYFDRYATPLSFIPQAGTLVTTAALVSSGDTNNDRTGNVINPTSLLTEFVVTYTTADPFRIIIFWDSQPNGAVPVLASTSNANSLLDDSIVAALWMAPRNMNSVQRFKILSDKTYQPYTSTSVSTPTNVMVCKERIKLSRKVHFNAANVSTTIANVTTNSLCIAIISFGGTCSLDRYKTRLYFRDA